MKKYNKMTKLLYGVLIITLLFSGSFTGLCADKVITWEVPSMASTDDPTYQGLLRYAELVKEASGGRLVIKPFASDAIVPGGTEFDAVMNGEVPAGHITPAWSINYIPAAYCFGGIPGGLTATQYALWLAHEGKELAREIYEPLGVVLVDDITVHPAEVWAHSKRPIKSLDDLKGLKIRLGDASVSTILGEMGASPVFFPAGEVYESMQRGVIDAAEYITPSVNWDMGFHEVANYMYISPSRCPMDNQSLFVNKKVWDDLPSDLKVILESVAKKVAQDFFAEMLVRDVKALEDYKAYGTVVERVPQDIEDMLAVKAAEYFANETEKDPVYKKIYDSAMNYKKICEELGIQ